MLRMVSYPLFGKVRQDCVLGDTMVNILCVLTAIHICPLRAEDGSIHLLPEGLLVMRDIQHKPSCKVLGKCCLIRALQHRSCSLAQRMVPGSKDLLGGSALIVV